MSEPNLINGDDCKDLYLSMLTMHPHPLRNPLHLYRISLFHNEGCLETLEKIATYNPHLYYCLWLQWCLPLEGNYADAIAKYGPTLWQTLPWSASRLMATSLSSVEVELPLHLLELIWYWMGEKAVEWVPLEAPQDTFFLTGKELECLGGETGSRTFHVHFPTLLSLPMGQVEPQDSRPPLAVFLRRLRTDREVLQRLYETEDGPVWKRDFPLPAEIIECDSDV